MCQRNTPGTRKAEELEEVKKLAYIFLFALWLVFMSLVIVMARSRGRSEINYALGALLLSPLLVIVILAIAGKDNERIRRLAISKGTSRVCPACMELVDSRATICRFCRSALSMV